MEEDAKKAVQTLASEVRLLRTHVERPVIGNGFWFAASVAILCGTVILGLRYVKAPPKQVVVEVDAPMISNAVSNLMDRFAYSMIERDRKEWAVAGARSYVFLKTKAKLADNQISVKKVLDVAEKIRPEIKLKVDLGKELKQGEVEQAVKETKKNESK